MSAKDSITQSPRKLQPLDLKKFEEDLKAELTPLPTYDNPRPKCSVKFHVHKHCGKRLSIHETDDFVDIKINPHKVRTSAQLDRILNSCRKSLVWG